MWLSGIRETFLSPKTTKKTYLKSEAFGSHNGESLYLLIVEVVIMILSPNK
jgi:hypothetical protein